MAEGVDAEGGVEGPPVALRALEEAIRDDPTSFGFFQLVRTLERLRPGASAPGRFVDPATEFARFAVNPSISFPPAEIHAVDLPADGPARVSVNFLGLTGPQGVLPHHYTLLAAERRRARDGAMAAFLDLFHHRLISLFYRAWEKQRFTIASEKGEADRLEEHLFDLVGAGLESHREGLPVAPRTLVFYAGLLAAQPRSALALEQWLADYFDVPVEVEPFVGGWQPLPRADQCALGEDEGPSARLGGGAVVGGEVWDQQSRVRIRIGPLDRARYDRFLPARDAYRELQALVRFFSHDQFEFELRLVLRREEVPGLVLGAGDDAPQPLGWSTWIRTAGPPPRDADETIFAL